MDGAASDGMTAFGDAVLFAAVLGISAALPTALAIFLWIASRSQKRDT
jgi:hypothetical protein